MKLKTAFLFPLLMLAAYCHAQLAAFQDDDDLINPSFRYDVIKAKHIASITIHLEYKPDGAPITDNGEMKYFQFDSLGRLVQSYFTIKEGFDTWDTIRSQYYYDASGNLIIKRTNEGVFYDTWYYRWYKDGNMKKRVHVHEAPLASTDDSFRIGTQTVISADSFAYATYPKQVQRYGYNEENKIYEKTISQYDNKHRMLSRNFHYAVGWLYSQVDLKYDASGRVVEYTYSGNLNGEVHHTVKIQYDSTGNFASQKIFDGDKQTDNIEYMYDSTGLIQNQLDRNYPKAVINITRFNYEFR